MAAKKVAKVGIKKEKGYLYFVDKHGDISCAKWHAAAKREVLRKKWQRLVLRKKMATFISLTSKVTSPVRKWFVGEKRKKVEKDNLSLYLTAPHSVI